MGRHSNRIQTRKYHRLKDYKFIIRTKIIHRSLMVRIAGFHSILEKLPADPGSIPGDEDRLGRTQKATRERIKKNKNK